MTHESDFVKVQSQFFGSLNLRLNKLGLSWPPPQFLVFDGGSMREATADDPRDELLARVRMSEITDKQIESMSHVARGAEYKYVEQSK